MSSEQTRLDPAECWRRLVATEEITALCLELRRALLRKQHPDWDEQALERALRRELGLEGAGR